MNQDSSNYGNDLCKQAEEIECLRRRLAEAERSLSASVRDGVNAQCIHYAPKFGCDDLLGVNSLSRMMVETLQEGALIATIQGEILYANLSFCSMMGFSQAFCVGKVLDTFLSFRSGSRLDACNKVKIGICIWPSAIKLNICMLNKIKPCWMVFLNVLRLPWPWSNALGIRH